MAFLSGIVTDLFDLVCRPLGGQAAWAMVLIAAVTGLWALWLFKIATPQRRLRRQKDRLMGHILEMGMYQDHLGVLARIQRDLALANLRYLSLSLPALAVLLVPMVLTLAQLDGRFAHRPLWPGESTVLKVTLKNPGALSALSLDLPPGVVVAAGPVKDPATGTVVWRLRADGSGTLPLKVIAGDRTIGTATLTTGRGLALLGYHSGSRWWDRLLYPGGQALPADSPVAVLGLDYPARHIRYLGVELNWLVAFMVLSLAAGLVGKEWLGVQM